MTEPSGSGRLPQGLRKELDMKKITAKQAAKIANRLNLQIEDDGMTFYATDEEESEIYSFDTKSERDSFCKIIPLLLKYRHV